MGYNKKWRDIAELKYGKSLKGYRDNVAKYPVYGTNGKIGYTKNPLAKGPGIIIGRKGAYRGVHFSEKDFFVIDTAYYLSLTDPNIDIKWAYYELINKDINSLDSGSAIPSTKREDFYALPVKIPPLSVQKRIAQVLNTFDSKIKINEEIIQNLEQLIQTLFKHWFVDFEFPNENGEPYRSDGGKMMESELGMIPEGWEVSTLDKVATVKSGKRPKSKSDLQTAENWVPLIGASKIMGYTNNVLYDKPIVVTGRVGTHGVIQKFHEACWPSDNTLVIESPLLGFVYQFLHTVDLRSLNRGSTQPLITQTDIKKLKCILPPNQFIKMFERDQNKFSNMIINNKRENKNLIELRDTLLPKLLSGELELPTESEVTDHVPVS